MRPRIRPLAAPTARLFLFLAALLAVAPGAYALDWQPPNPDELKMTADPSAPGADAVYLYREETSDDKLHMHYLYARIKVLTEKGKRWGDAEIPAYNGRSFTITDVAERTIHPDGTIIPLTGKPLDKLLLREGKDKFKSTVFSLPSVEPGSILEYRYKLRYDQEVLLSPRWYIQQPIYMHKAHYRFVPFQMDFYNHVTVDHDDIAQGLTWAGRLPEGSSVKEVHEAYEVDVANVPALPDESYMPPLQGISYRLIFYYASAKDPAGYWKREGKFWSKDVNHFADPSKTMHAAVDSLITPADAPEAKLRKLYAAVMAMENTSFTREHSAAENKAEGVKVKTADDIWGQKRGNAEDLTRLFIALARAAGFKAYDMKVVNRDRDIFLSSYMDWRQLDDEIAIVNLNGADLFFDPGERYAEYGKLHWKHTLAEGVRQVDDGTAIAKTASIGYKDSQVARFADLTLDEHDAVTGVVRITMTGAPALHWRQRALEVDADELHRDYEHSIRDEFPAGVEPKFDHFIGLTDPESALMATVKVEGALGTATGHRLLMPASFFTSGAGSIFPQQKREMPIDLHYPILRQDQVKVHLPAEFKIESLPQSADLSLPKCAAYSARYSDKDGTYTHVRSFALGVALYMPNEYAGLRDFYQKVGTKDNEQAVLTVASSAGTK